MWTFMTGLLLVLAIQEEDPTKEFTDLCQALIQAESYSFQMVLEDGGGMGMRGMGREGTPAPTKIQGKFQKGLPYLVTSSGVDAYRIKDATVYKGEEGKWTLFDSESMRGAFRRGGERNRAPRISQEELLERFDKDGDGELSDEERAESRRVLEEERRKQREEQEEERRREREEGEEEDHEEGEGEEREEGRRTREPRERETQGAGEVDVMRTIFSLSRTTLPHETLEKIVGKVNEIKREEKEGEVCYSGILSKEAADALSGSSRFGRMRRGRGDEGGPRFEQSGTVKIIVADGVLQKIEITTKMSGSFGERTFERTRKSMIQPKDLGKVKVEVPEEALSKFVL